MVCSPWVLKALADIPALVGSAAVVLLASALLPPTVAAAVVVVGVAAVLLLCAGRCEPITVRLLYRGRAARPVESVALAPVLVELCARGLGPPVINLYIRDTTHDHAAQGVGRRSVLIDGNLVQALQAGRVQTGEAAAVIAHAIGRSHHGSCRSDLMIRALTMPWRPVQAAGRAIAYAVARLPLTVLGWRMRFIVAAVAVAQSAVDGRTTPAAVIASIVTMTYLSPRAQRALDQLTAQQGDRFAQAHGFGPSLVAYLRRLPTTNATLTRIQDLRCRK